MDIVVNSPNVKYSENYIESNYEYLYTKAEKSGSKIEVRSFIIRRTSDKENTAKSVARWIISSPGRDDMEFSSKDPLENQYIQLILEYIELFCLIPATWSRPRLCSIFISIFEIYVWYLRIFDSRFADSLSCYVNFGPHGHVLAAPRAYPLSSSR